MKLVFRCGTFKRSIKSQFAAIILGGLCFLLHISVYERVELKTEERPQKGFYFINTSQGVFRYNTFTVLCGSCIDEIQCS